MMAFVNRTMMLAITILLFMVIAPASSQTVPFNLKEAAYSPFVRQVRNAVKSPTLIYHGLPMIRPPANPAYFYVEFNVQASGTNPAFTIGLQLKTADLYVVAYRDRDGTTNRAFYFRGEVTEKDVFSNIAGIVRQETKVGFDYDSLEAAAGQKIQDLQFGVANWESVLRNIYGRKDTTAALFKRDQARFFLVTILSVAEAARFAHIEKRVDFSQVSNLEVKSLVKNWGSLSKQIIGADANGNFKNPVTIQVTDNRDWIITKVSDIKPDIGILKYVKPGSVVVVDGDELSGGSNSIDNNDAPQK